MALTVLTVGSYSNDTERDAALVAATSEIEFENNENIEFIATLTGTGSIFTFVGQRECNFDESHDLVVAPGTNETHYWRTFGRIRFNNVNGRVRVNLSVITGISVGAFNFESGTLP